MQGTLLTFVRPVPSKRWLTFKFKRISQKKTWLIDFAKTVSQLKCKIVSCEAPIIASLAFLYIILHRKFLKVELPMIG